MKLFGTNQQELQSPFTPGWVENKSVEVRVVGGCACSAQTFMLPTGVCVQGSSNHTSLSDI